MKYLILIPLLILSIMTSQAQNEKLTKISCHYNGDHSNLIANLSRIDNGEKEMCAISQFNKNGNCHFMIEVEEPGFYLINFTYKSSGRDHMKDHDLNRVYLEPGTNIKFVVDNDLYKLIETNCEKNRLLSQWNEKVDSLYTYSHGFGYTNLNYKDFFPKVPEFVKMTEDFKSEINTSDPDFNKLMNLLVEIDLNNACFHFLMTPREFHPTKEEWPEYFKELVEKGNTCTTDILKLPHGLSYCRTFGSVYTSYNNIQYNHNQRHEYFKESIKAIENDTLKAYTIIDNLYGYKAYDDQYLAFKNLISPYLLTDDLKDKIKYFETSIRTYAKGSPAADFSGTTIDDKEIKLSDFKGQIVYVDVWATWCGPCKEEIPHLIELEKKFHGQPITFLSISVDKLKDREKWIEYVKEHQLKGVQIMAEDAFNSDVTKLYDIKAIPRFMLFDKEGKIVTIDAPRPSDPKTEELLNNLL